MATAATDDYVEYDSDPEEAKRSLTTRRTEASDEEGEEERDRSSKMTNSTPGIDSEVESEGQGAPEEYDEEESEEYHEFDDLGDGEVVQVANEVDDEGTRSTGGEVAGEAKGGEEGKKENEPFAVPTAGAFYMHDDRFRDNARGRSRRMLGGTQLWESQDNRRWGHDKFEEMTHQQRRNDEVKKNSRGRYRGRGKNRGGDRGDSGGNKSNMYDAYNQNQLPKITKGRGFRKYDSLKKNKNEAPPTQYRQRSGKPSENPSHSASGRAPSASSDLKSVPVSSSKQAFASSLNVASPPFYPSGTSSIETTCIQKRDVQAGNVNRGARTADDETLSVDSIGMEKLHINDRVSSKAGQVSVGSSTISSAHQRAQGRGVTSSGQMSFQTAASGNMGSGHGDQNFAAAPTFLPVMQFGGQHPGGMGVPAVGMAIPGYVSQPNGSGKPEMTWLPVLTGPAGALGSAYGSSYIAALESAYRSRPSGNSSSSGASSNNSNTNKSNKEGHPLQRPEATSDEVGQRQKYTRRYTEMKFGQ